MTIVCAAVLAVLFVHACGDGDDDASGDPIDARIDAIFPRDPVYGAVDRVQLRRMITTPPEQDRPFFMINLIRHRERAEYPDGRETDLTGRQADDLYGALILPVLLEIGAAPLFVADVETSLIDEDDAAWTQVAIVRYPSRAAFVAMLERPDVREIAVHKAAGVERTIVLVSEIGDVDFPPELRRVDLDAVAFPPTPQDPPVAVVHLLRYNVLAHYEDGRETDLTGREAMALYEQARQAQGVLELGVRPGIWLAVEGELIGDGRVWDELRLNNFPSRATFAEVSTAESLEEAGIEHRVAALADTYAVLAAPMINGVGYQ